MRKYWHDRIAHRLGEWARTVLPPVVYRAWRSCRIRAAVARVPPHVVTRQFGSVSLRVTIADSLAERWYDVDWPALPELDALREHGLGPGARVMDLGAHQGIVALVLAQIVGPDGLVIAVEPGAHNARVAEQNRELNAAVNLTVVRAAAGDGRRASVSFVEALNGRVGDHRASDGLDQVPLVSIDDLAERFGSPDVVVVDVEGFEANVVAGASTVLRAGATSFLVEVHAGCGLEATGASVDDVLSAFPPEDYRRWVSPITAERTYSFRPLEDHPAVTKRRFFLLAAPA